MNNGIYIGRTPNGVEWICYEPKTEQMMREAFKKMTEWQTRDCNCPQCRDGLDDEVIR